LDLFDFINPDSSSHLQDKTYDKIISNWNEFMGRLSSDDDKQVLLKILNKCYFKYHKSIKVYGISDFELTNVLLISIITDQQIQIDGLKYK
jgi:hypothetical protein